MLPEKHSDRDLSVLRSDPEKGNTQLKRVRTASLLIGTALIFGWLILVDFQDVSADGQAWAGWLNFVKFALALLGAWFAWFIARFWTPKVLGTWWALGLILGAGWLIRGFFEAAMENAVSRQGFYTGARMVMWLFFGFIVSWALLALHRRGMARQDEEGA